MDDMLALFSKQEFAKLRANFSLVEDLSISFLP